MYSTSILLLRLQCFIMGEAQQSFLQKRYTEYDLQTSHPVFGGVGIITISLIDLFELLLLCVYIVFLHSRLHFWEYTLRV